MQYNYGYVYRLYSPGGHGYPEVTIGYYLIYHHAVTAKKELKDDWLTIEPIKLADYGGQW